MCICIRYIYTYIYIYIHIHIHAACVGPSAEPDALPEPARENSTGAG